MKRQLLGRRASAVVVAVAAVTTLSIGAGGVSAADRGAHAARRTHHLTDTIYLHLVRKNGSTLYERGTATGTLPGSVSARFVTGVTRVTGSVTFYPRGGGSLTLNAVGYPHSTSTITTFNGNVAVRSGTGRYSRALGSGTLTGTANRRTWAITVRANATLTY
jgi:hypothetical protein